MKKLIVLLVILVSLICVRDAPAPLLGSFYGKVYNSESNLPVKGVTIVSSMGYSGVSQADGSYDVPHWEADNFTLTATKNYYTTVVKSDSVRQREYIQLDWYLDYYGSKPSITEPDYNEWRPAGYEWEVTWRTAASTLGVRKVSLELRGPSGCSDDAHLTWIGQALTNDGSHFWTPQIECVNGCYISICAEDVCNNSDMFYITNY